MTRPDSTSPTEQTGNPGQRRIVIGVLAILAVVATVIGIQKMGEAPAAGGGPGGGAMQMPPAAVFVEIVVTEETQAEAVVTGSLRAVSQAEIAGREPGAVVEVLVNEGDVVSKGDVIAKLDSRRAIALLDESKAKLASARSLLGQRKVELDRAVTDRSMKRQLFDRKAVSQSDVLDAEEALSIAEAQLKVASDGVSEAESRLSYLDVQLEDLVIQAPFAGVIVDRRVEVGEWVTAGAVVAVLVTVDPVEAWLRVPTRYLDGLRGEDNGLSIKRSSTGATVESVKVDLVPDVEPLSQLFNVVATVANPNRDLAPGESVTGIVPVGRKQTYLRVASDAIVPTAMGNFVQIVVPPAEAGAMPGARRVPVSVEFERDSFSYIALEGAGIVEGEQVVVEGNERLAPGQSLMIQTKDVAGSAPEIAK